MKFMEFQLKQIGKKKVYRKILDEIWQSIHRYNMKPGDKLPTESYLAKQLNVARPTLREALSVLDYVGILESVQGGGYYVKSVTPILSPLLLSRIGKSTSPYELVIARLSVEPEICKLAAAQRTEKDLAHLVQTLKKMEDKIALGTVPSEEDNAFHMGIARATSNIILVSMVDALMSLNAQMLYEAIEASRYRHNPKLNDMQLDHEVIFKAVKDQNADKACAAMKCHLLRIKKDLFDAAG